MPHILADMLRILADTFRILADTSRILADTPRILADIPRILADTSRILADTSRILADMPRILANTPRILANTPPLLANPSRLLADTLRLLAMAKGWLPVMTANAEAWGISPAVTTDFAALTGAADTAAAPAKNETARTPVVTARCREAFTAMTDKMRDIKRRRLRRRIPPPRALTGTIRTAHPAAFPRPRFGKKP
jgi:hypothetical protein